jgi:uncharacterized membrane protein YgdD (TMEM256/DUF423 family)
MQFIRIAAITGCLAVILGAFGAHTLKSVLPGEALDSFETGVRYQFYHTLALLLCGLMSLHRDGKYLVRAGWLFVAGMALFSGSIYLLSTRTLTGLEAGWLGPITPIGGVLFIAGWIMLFLHAGKRT